MTYLPIQNEIAFADRRRSAPDDQAISDISPWEILRGIWARKELVAAIFVISMALAMGWIYTVTPSYTVETRVLLEPRNNEISNFDAMSSPSMPDAETLQSEIQVMTSRPLIQRLITDLNLDSDPEFNPALRRGFFGGMSNRPTDMDVVASQILGRLSVYQKTASRVIAIDFTASRPETAASIANRLAELYIMQLIEQRSGLNSEATKWLGKQIEELRVKVRDSEAKVEAFRAASGLFLTNGSTLPQQQLTDLNSQLTIAEADRAEAQAKLENARALLASGNAVNSAAEVLQSPLIQNLRQQEVALRAQIAQNAETLLPTHPRMLEAQANLRDLDEQIEKEVRKVISALDNQANVAAARVGSLRASLAALKTRMGTLNQDEVQLRALQRDADTNRALLESFLKRYEEANAKADIDTRTASARIVSRAEVPSTPTFPKKSSAMVFAAIASLILSLAVAFLLEVFAQGFRTGEQIERATGMPFLGLVPELGRMANARPADEVVRDPYGGYAEAIRMLQANVLTARIGNRRARTVLVASAQAGEGKTTTAASLARMLAMAGYRTILVDADMHRPAAPLALGVPMQAGLAELLTGRANFHHVISRDTLSYAHVLQAGGRLPNPTAALASAQMASVMSALQQTYDFVIIDSPAALSAADAQVLVRLADVTVLNVRWRKTSRHVVNRVLRILAATGGRRVGILMTRVDLKRYKRYTDATLEAYTPRSARAA